MLAAARKRVEEVAAQLGSLAESAPKVGIVLGSGLGTLVDAWPARRSLPFHAVSAMPRSSVEGHAGNFVWAAHGALSVIAMQGRIHLYEGHDPETVVLGVRAMVAR
jgi:purine nucleoside phosphorylase